MRVSHTVANMAGRSQIANFMTEVPQRWKFEHEPHLVQSRAMVIPGLANVEVVN